MKQDTALDQTYTMWRMIPVVLFAARFHANGVHAGHLDVLPDQELLHGFPIHPGMKSAIFLAAEARSASRVDDDVAHLLVGEDGGLSDSTV